MQVPKQQLGALALERLIDVILQEDPVKIKTTVFTRLIERESVLSLTDRRE